MSMVSGAFNFMILVSISWKTEGLQFISIKLLLDQTTLSTLKLVGFQILVSKNISDKRFNPILVKIFWCIICRVESYCLLESLEQKQPTESKLK